MPETSEAAQGKPKPSSGACGSVARSSSITAGRWCTRGRRGRRWRKTSASICPPWWRRSRRRREATASTGVKQQRAVCEDRQRSGAFGAMTKRGDSSPSSDGAYKQEVVDMSNNNIKNNITEAFFFHFKCDEGAKGVDSPCQNLSGTPRWQRLPLQLPRTKRYIQGPVFNCMMHKSDRSGTTTLEMPLPGFIFVFSLAVKFLA